MKITPKLGAPLIELTSGCAKCDAQPGMLDIVAAVRELIEQGVVINTGETRLCPHGVPAPVRDLAARKKH